MEGFGKLLGTSCREILIKRPSNFCWNCNFSLHFSLLTYFALIFFAVWSVSLACEQSEKKTLFFASKRERKSPHFRLFSLYANMSGAPYLQLLHSEFPYTEENFIFFFISVGTRNRVGTELSYCPASLCCLTGRYDNPIPAQFL
jgi:hypothetical protein